MRSDLVHAASRRAGQAGIVLALAGFAAGTVSDAFMADAALSMATGALEVLIFGLGLPLVATVARRTRADDQATIKYDGACGPLLSQLADALGT